jgi:hypothetical protein
MICSTQGMSFQKSNAIQEQMSDDDNYSDKRKEGGIDEQEEDSLTQTQKSTLKKKITCLKRKSSS